MSSAPHSDTSTPPADTSAAASAHDTGNSSVPCEPTMSSESEPKEGSVVPAEAAVVSLCGSRFGDFELVDELGRGGMGVVYKAKQFSLDRFVAIKLLLAEHSRNATVLTRFLTEARTAAGLDHPNVVKVYQVGECGHGHFFAMEFIDGPTLDSLVQRQPLAPRSAVAIMILVADAVHYAHTKGIIHRDLKPGNVMLDSTRRPVVMDFGIAKSIGQSASLTQQGSIMGTPGYMPPEQAGEDPGRIGPHSDVYSLGAILYCLLTGRAPFDEPTALKTILKVVGPEAPPPISQFRSDVPAELEAICMKCMSKRPEDRYVSAHKLSKDLRRIRGGKPSKAATEFVSRQPGQPAPSTPVPGALTPRPTPTPEAPPAVLVEHGSGKRIPLPHGTTIIGRAGDCDIIVRAADVSKRHCQIHFNAYEGAVVEDLKSVNGTTVNGFPANMTPLRDGDALGVAEHVFHVSIAKNRGQGHG